MTKLIRFLAVIAIALSPVWGVQTVHAASSPAPARYPVWPSFLSTGCQAIQGPTGSTTISCADASFLLSQVNSGYACNQLDINISTFNSGHFLATATVNSGSQSNSVSITSSGSYYMQFPGFLVNNLITIQIQAVSAGSMSIASIQTNPCPVATATDTPNPSNTATNTPVPVTGTPTPIATFTPLPSGHNTYTPSTTPTPVPSASTATATSTPLPSYYDCGGPTYPLLNCNFTGAVGGTIPAPHWNLGAPTGATLPECTTGGGGPYFGVTDASFSGGLPGIVCDQHVLPHATGDVYIRFQAHYFFGNSGPWYFSLDGGSTTTQLLYGSCDVGSGNWCEENLGAVTDSADTDFAFLQKAGPTESAIWIYIDNIFVSSSADTPTPAPATGTPTPAPGTSTPTPVPSDTDVPIPGAMSTNIPTATECPGGCAVTALTAIPGMATRTMVDTSPFSALTHLSMARSSCAPFGYVQIPYPVITGTPIMGEPLNFGWTVPVTHTWDNTNPLSNTAIQPCAMSEIPSSLWDFTYWFSVFGIATVFIMWLIGLVGRLSGEETING